MVPILEQFNVKSVQSVRARTVMVHLGLSVGAILLPQFQQVQTLLEIIDHDLNEPFHAEALLFVLDDRKRLLQSHIALVEQVIELVIVDLEVAAPQHDTLFTLLTLR